tara:strand:+ start:830 stop:1627 length:798 start_codon:yes stop_codon:yes gene_type:complete
MNKKIINHIISQSKIQPKIGVVLGSGLQQLASSLENIKRIKYSDIPSFFDTTVDGHEGEFITGNIKDTDCQVIFANGRFHYYEGLSYDKVHIIIDIFNELGCKYVITTNSSGCLVPEWAPGDIMILDSHIDMTFRGDTTEIQKKSGPDYYDTQLLNIAANEMKLLNIPIRKGTYGWTLGPTYETPAEIKYFKTIDIDAVGMSTVPEIERAYELKLKLLGMACLTNYAVGISDEMLTHEEVVTQANKTGKLFSTLLLKILKQINSL